MKSYRQKIKKYYRILYWIIVFLITIFLLNLILPGDPKFKFEYQKGTSWKHDNLVAPFDFAISKTEDEIKIEKQVLTKNIPPYFKIDTLVFTNQMASLDNDLKLHSDSSIILNSIIYPRIINAFNQIYNNGILLHSADSYEILKDKSEIARLSGNVSTIVSIDVIYSEKTAYNYITQIENQILSDYPELRENIEELDIGKYIKSNLEFDPVTTQKQNEEIETGISTTHGMIQAGERIILKGEMVDSEKFNILESLKNTYEKKRGEGVNKYMITTGKLLLITIFISLIFIFLFYYRKDIVTQLRRITFLLFLVVIMVFVSIFANSFEGLHIYLVPMAILPIVIRTFFDSRTAIFTLFITSLIIGLYAPNSFEYVLIQVIAGIVAVFSLVKMHRRVHLVMASFWVLLAYIISYSAINTIQEGSILNINYTMFKWFAGSCLLINLAYPLIYIFEKLFGFISDVTLIEISDINQPLLRKLAEEAPGTFQHSMQIANISEEVILKIGGNPFLVRAGALYHDIGKIAKADYFTENQFGIQNPHDLLSYTKSSEIIINHVQNGEKLAKKHNLPESLIEFISTHHGTTQAKYFYLKHKEENPDFIDSDNEFKYPGPLPRSKEAAVVMIVDGIEAASRSLSDKNKDNLKELINRMVDQKVNDHQLDNSNLTFNDIKNIKTIILNKLLNIYHVRIAYPKEEIKKD